MQLHGLKPLSSNRFSVKPRFQDLGRFSVENRFYSVRLFRVETTFMIVVFDQKPEGEALDFWR